MAEPKTRDSPGSIPSEGGGSGQNPPGSVISKPVSTTAHWIGLGFLTLAVLTSVVDSSVMTVVTPTISTTFHATLPVVEWTTTIYSLFFGATMLLWGKMGSIFGHRRLFIFGSALFAAGSALVGWAPNIGIMIAMRALQGIGAAMFNPAAIALIGLLFSSKDRPLAYGINGMAGSIGVALGYVLGGACAEFLDWRWAFYVNLPICALAIIGALRFVPRAAEPGHPHPLDVFGAFESLLGLGLLIAGLSEAQTLGWGRAKVPYSVFGLPMHVSLAPFAMIMCTVVLIGYATRELRLTRRGREPVFDVTLFLLPSFRWGGVITMLRYLAQFTVNYGVTLYLQIDEGIPALRAGLISVPNALAGLLAGPAGGWLASRIGAARSVQLGLLCQSLGIAWVWWVLAPHLSIWDLVGPFALFGFGAGLAGAQLNTASLQEVGPERMGDAASAVTTFRQLGGSFAVAVFGILAATTTVRLTLEGYDRTLVGARSMRDVVLVMFLINLACLGLSFRIPNRGFRMAAAAKT
jgi:EmrB/QacA subfamily drug resistance transporter